MPLMHHPIAFACPACSASSLRRYAADSTTAAAAHPKTKSLTHSVSRRFSRLLFACAPLLLGAAALVPAAPAQAQAEVVNICDRTPEVETAILARLSHSGCGAVTSAQLAGIDTIQLYGGRITSLRYGDFSGLSSLTLLILSNTALTSLPAGVFSGLSSLEFLRLDRNRLTSLPEGVFSGLSSLERLHLHHNALTSLPAGVFSGLISLGDLRLRNNALTSLPSGVFSGLSRLASVNLSFNDLTSLPDGVFSGLSSLETLSLYGNALTSLPEGVFSGSSNLRTLQLYDNALTSLPESVFSGLIRLRTLRLSGNSGAPFQVALSLESDPATRTIRILVPLGAPEDLAIPLSFSGGTVAGSTTATVTIPTGVTKSPPVAVDFADTTGTATVSFGTLPALTPYSGYPRYPPSGIDGLALVAGR